MNITGCRALNDGEIQQILAGMSGRYALRDRAIFIFGVRTGFRISEILSLRVKDIWEKGAIKNSVTVSKERMKGGEKSRTMPLHLQAKEALTLYIRGARLDHDFHLNSALFPRQGGIEAMGKKQYWAIIKTAASRAGVSTERLGTHSMRKVFASRLWPKMGGDLLKMACVMGHENPTNTARYVQFLDGSLESAVLSV